MRETLSAQVRPIDVSREAGRSVTLVYKYFRSIDRLVEEVIKTRLVFPVVEELLAGTGADGDEVRVVERVAIRVHDAFEMRPETLDIIGWSFGNTDPLAVGVMLDLYRFCEALAERTTGKALSASLYFGVIASLLCDRQIPAGKGALWRVSETEA